MGVRNSQVLFYLGNAKVGLWAYVFVQLQVKQKRKKSKFQSGIISDSKTTGHAGARLACCTLV